MLFTSTQHSLRLLESHAMQKDNSCPFVVCWEVSHINKVTIKAVYRYHMRGMYYKLYAFYIKYINLYTFIFIYIYKLSGFLLRQECIKQRPGSINWKSYGITFQLLRGLKKSELKRVKASWEETKTSVCLPPLTFVISIIPYLNGSRAAHNSFLILCETMPGLINIYEGSWGNSGML